MVAAVAQDEDAYWVAWRCADGSDVQRWYHLPALECLAFTVLGLAVTGNPVWHLALALLQYN